MKPVEGLEDALGTILAEVKAARLVEQRQAIAGQVNGIYTNLRQWQAQKKRADTESQKLGEKISKAQAKLEAIAAGDWSVLQEEQKEPGDGKKTTSAVDPDD